MTKARPGLLPALLSVLLGACGGGGPGPDAGATPAPPPDPRWAGSPLPRSEAPSALLTQWGEAENRERCAPLAPSSLGEGEDARPRAARFGGGWGVAWDLPELRSAFGVAGTGIDASEPSYDAWPHRLQWSDGSTAGYGPEGGSGPNELAYLRIPGQACLYNVWSRLGRAHLEHLLQNLAFVDTGAGGGR